MLKNRIAVSILFGVNGFLSANFIARLPLLQSTHGLDNSGIGMVLLVSAIGALVAMPFTGWLIVGNGSRRISAAASMLLCMIVAMMGLMPNAVFLGLLFFVLGLSTGTMDVAMNAQAVMVEQGFKRPIMTSFHAIFSAGMMLGAGSGALFTYLETSLKWHLFIVASFSFLLVLWAIFNLIRDARTVGGQSSQHRFQLPEASLVGVGLIAFCCMLGEGAMANWSTNYMLNIAQAGVAFAPLGLATFSLAMMFARFFGDRARAQMGDRSLMIRSSIVAAFGLGLVLLLPNPFIVLLGLFLVGLGLSVIVPIAYSTAGNAPGLSPGVGIGMVTTIGYAGFLLGPPIIGFLADWQSLRVALLFTLALFVVMTMLSFRFRQVTGS